MEATSSPDPRRWKALIVLSIAYLMVVLDTAIVNVALPTIQDDLGFASENLQWVVTAYGLTFGGFLLLGGRAGDILGRRRLFITGLVLFAGFSLLCGFASSSGMLIAGRALQGFGAALLAPSVFSIVSVMFREGAERNKALGVLGAIGGSGAAIGVLLGGVFAEFIGWEWIFFINVPIAAVALFMVPIFVKESKAAGLSREFDAAGAISVTASLMLFVFAVTQTTSVGWTSAQTIGCLIASVILMIAFLVIETKVRSPLVRLGFFRQRTPAAANLVGFGLGTAIFGTFFLLSLYQQQVLGFSALETGLGYLAVSLTAIVSSALSQALVTRVGIKPVLSLGLALLAGGLAYFTQVSVDGSYVSDLLPGFLLVGVGIGFSFVPVSIAALTGVSAREAGLASGLINTSQQIGGALGLALLVTVVNTRTDNLLGDDVELPAALTAGFSLAFWVAIGFAVVALTATLVMLRANESADPEHQTPSLG
jgi:EmrB/QacA subfamily drug resistance transporter